MAAPITVLSRVLSAVSGALLGGGPSAPVDTPAVWVLAAAARRQFGQTTGTPTGVLDPITTGQPLAAAAANQPPTTKYFAGTPNATTGVVTGSVTATDKDRDPLTFTGPVGGVSAKGGSVAVDGKGKFTYTPTVTTRQAAARTGASAADKVDTFTVTVDDGHGHVVPQVVSVKVSPLEVAATVTHVNLNTGVATGVITTADPGAYTYKTTTSKKGTLVVASDGTFTYTPTAAARAAASAPRASASTKTDAYTVTLTDAAGKKSTVKLTVSIAPTGHVNQAPTGGLATVGQPDPTTGVVTGTVTATDPEGDALTYSGSTSTTKGSVTVNSNGTFTYTPTPAARHAAAATSATAADKQDTFTATVTDALGGTETVPVTVTILPSTNASPGNANVTVGQPDPTTGVVTGNVTATDPENDTLVYGGSTTTATGSVTVNANGSFTYTPTAAAMHNASATNAATTGADKDAFTITIDDGHGGSTTKQVVVTVLGTNVGPTNANVTVGQPDPTTGVVTGNVTATDPENDTLVYGGSTTTAKGSVTVNANGSFTYTPTAAAMHNASATNAATTGADKDAFTVTIDDGHGGTDGETVSVVIRPTNAAPVGGSAIVVTTEPTTGVVTGMITGVTDNDGDSLTYSAPATSSGGATLSVNSSTGAFTYTPTNAMRYRASLPGAPTSATQDTFAVAVIDGHGGTTTVPVSVTVDPGYPAGTVKRDPVTGDIAVKAAATTTAYDWVGFNPNAGSRGLENADVVSWDVIRIGGSPTDNLTTGQPSYAPGSVKVDPVTGDIAIRSGPDNLAGDWFVFDPTNGGYYATSAQVAQFLDVPSTESAETV